MKSEAQQTKLNFNLLRLTLVLLMVLIGIGTVRAGTLTVNTNADSNVCDSVLTLREAMLIGFGSNALGRPLTTSERNQISGATFAAAFPPAGCSITASYWSITSGAGGAIVDNIVFSTSVTNILITSGLPNITWAEDIINGLKSDGTKAAIDGTAAGSVPGLRVTATIGFTIRNLIIKNFQYEGILLENSENGVFEGMEIFGNGGDGIALVPYTYIDGTYNSRNNRIGGTNPSQRNFIYSNGHSGIAIIASQSSDRFPDLGNIIENNYIGLKDNNGNADFGNGWDGIYLEHAFGNRIGGDTAASRNVISGNQGNGIWMRGLSHANRLVNNFLGTNSAGNAVIGNSQSGIAVSEGAQNNQIGGVGQGNVICGNYFGIALYDSNTSGNIIRGNAIGTDLPVNSNLGNVGDGIAMGANTHDNIIGGAGSGEGNIIAFSTYSGIFMDNGFNNSIRGNRIFSNAGGLGIDLGTNGVTLNDFNDTDTGANNFQNYPLISSGSSGAGSTSFVGTINSTANTVLTLDFFVSPDRDPSGYGEGSTYLGSTTVTTNNVGNAGFNSSFIGIGFQGFYATATATDPSGNTSEFSPATRIGCSYSISPASQNFGTAGGTGSFNLTTTAACDWQAVRSDNWITITGGASGTGNGTVSFSVAANTGPARTGTITVGGRVFTITQASNCTYSLVSNTAGHPASGGSDGNSVIAPAGCTWTTISNNPWITVTSGSSSSGTASFTYSVAVNTGPARQGTLTVAGLTYFINQASGCTYQLSHFSAGYPASGTNFDGVSITAGSGCVWTATSNANWISITSGGSGTGSGSTTWSVAANTGAARQGTLTVAGSTFTINQAAAPRRAPFDFDGDGKTDISIFRPSVGEWWYLRSSDSTNRAAQFGASTDKLTPGDFTGDSKTDIAFWRPSTGYWFVLRSEDGSFFSFPFGTNGDIPAPADYDGDGKTDAAVFRPSDSTWYIRRSSDLGTSIVQFGSS
ncbi:MAG TPA: BACON domain-containing carbohydrate-binding protein, partial [Pyrinomonadaceae bacterium]|nr:BACON domain-containing carbohydrate-binding protein [Pyrinomonadaceae bacterium]